MDKKMIRMEISKKREQLSTECMERYNIEIQEVLFGLPEYKNADVILSYVSFEKEVDTHAIIVHALQSGKRVAVPRIIQKGTMEFYEINSFSELIPGKFGILEPLPEYPLYYDANLHYTMIMPGMAFDRLHNRIGYGGGYYDRYLERWLNQPITTIAIAYDFQIYERIPADDYDRKPDIILTPEHIYQAEKERCENSGVLG